MKLSVALVLFAVASCHAIPFFPFTSMIDDEGIVDFPTVVDGGLWTGGGWLDSLGLAPTPAGGIGGERIAKELNFGVGGGWLDPLGFGGFGGERIGKDLRFVDPQLLYTGGRLRMPTTTTRYVINPLYRDTFWNYFRLEGDAIRPITERLDTMLFKPVWFYRITVDPIVEVPEWLVYQQVPLVEPVVGLKPPVVDPKPVVEPPKPIVHLPEMVHKPVVEPEVHIPGVHVPVVHVPEVHVPVVVTEKIPTIIPEPSKTMIDIGHLGTGLTSTNSESSKSESHSSSSSSLSESKSELSMLAHAI